MTIAGLRQDAVWWKSVVTSSSWLRSRWKEGRAAFGGWCSTGSVLVAQTLAWQGFDYVAVDCQHSLLGHDTLRECVTGLAGCGAVPVVRVPKNDGDWIRRAVACGAQAVIVPQIESPGDAAKAVRNCQAAHAERRYRDMLGLRSGGLTEGADDPVVCVLMVESAIGISRIKQICAVDGIDSVYVGPRDLAITYGLAPKLELQTGPQADAARIVLDACRANNVVAGIHCESGNAARQLVRDGFQMVTVSSDQQFIRTESETALGQIRSAQLRRDSIRAADVRLSGA
jgi:4-hydroxy-2-oxoheptanedioate aldolase